MLNGHAKMYKKNKKIKIKDFLGSQTTNDLHKVTRNIEKTCQKVSKNKIN